MGKKIGEYEQTNAFIVKTSVVDPQTGEILTNRKFVDWSGWKDNCYRYRPRSKPVKFYMDIEWNLNGPEWNLFMMLCKMIDTNNLFIKRIHTSNKYFGKRYEIMTKDDIFENLPKKISRSTFNRAWNKLNGTYIKRIKVDKNLVWAVNPAFACRLDYLPLFLYIPFRDWIDQYITEVAKKKFELLELEKWKGV